MISPLSNIQKQFYINNIVYPKDTSYNVPLVYKVSGALNLIILENAVNAIINKYDILRSSFKRNGKQLYRLTHEEEKCKIKVEQVFLSTDFVDTNTAELDEEVHKRFNLEEWPLLRIKLFVYKNEVTVLSFIFHHIIIDLHSYNIFVNELSHYYNNYIEHIPVNSEKSSDYYTNFVDWESKWINTNDAAKMLDFWRHQFDARKHLLNLPTDFKRPAMQSKLGKRIYFALNEKSTSDVKQLAKLNAVAPFSILLAGYALLCHQLSGQNKIIIGVPLSNRRIANNKNIFGPLLNIAPIVIDFSDSKKSVELILHVRMALLKAHRNQEVPFLHMVNHLDIERSFAYSPIFQIGFAYEPRTEFSFNGVSTEPLVVERKGAQLDLFYSFWEDDKKIHGFMEYSSDLFAESTIIKWIDEFKNVIEYLCDKH
ncbi:condensation domain-containing protein [Labilibaculum antarcticum]|uniref:Condensation domain-containing protein n=1 Tax=Labilibaculum antarcticum TaxID=1717717 RepID=A0A1Y1CQ75_9BACT|nr:condensation domain-containing protein [Labilibaculum antarcticum]BAX82619.1 hypothetical protein ALGA_4329 [Labilibaculum antarcticum]